MKPQRLGRLALVVALSITLAGIVTAQVLSAAPRTAPALPSAPVIIIDHTMTDITQIPDYWLNEAKKLTLHYPHTSHGSQLMTGADWWEAQNVKYNIDVLVGGSPALPPDTTALRIYDGNDGDTYITPELYWSEEAGRNKTRSVANTNLFDYSMWSWCGQQSSNPTETVQLYLDTLNQFEQEYPAMRFIYMTGHTDIGSVATLNRNNDMVRSYVIANGKVLFDFADIESYYPDGTPVPANLINDSCPWCQAWCDAHPGDCANFDTMGDCAHTHPLLCKLKGGAFWWMMARLAGWDGQPMQTVEPYKIASIPNPTTNQTVTYKIVLQGLNFAPTTTVRLTDVIPVDLAYVSGTLSATAGSVTATTPVMLWSGTLSTSSAVTITYATKVITTAVAAIVNTAQVSVPGYTILSLKTTIIANGYSAYMPVLLK